MQTLSDGVISYIFGELEDRNLGERVRLIFSGAKIDRERLDKAICVFQESKKKIGKRKENGAAEKHQVYGLKNCLTLGGKAEFIECLAITKSRRKKNDYLCELFMCNCIFDNQIQRNHNSK